MHDVLRIESYSAAGNVIFPSVELTIQKDTIIGIHTDYAKINHLLAQFQLQQFTYIHYREEGLYEKLKLKEYLLFLKRIHNFSDSIDSFIRLLNLESHLKTKIGKLSRSEKQRLRFLNCIVNLKTILVIEEPFQNIDEHTKKIIVNGVHQLKEAGKQPIILSSNMDDLLISCDTIFRLNTDGLHLVDLQEDDNKDSQSAINTTHIRFEKIPTKRNDKIILFNPPEIDYIESVEGEVSVYVGGESYPCSLTLNELESKLAPFGFFRCHRSYIVNLQKVREIITWTRNSYSLSLHTKEEQIVPLSKKNLVELKRIIGI